jgi:hypothetical protein
MEEFGGAERRAGKGTERDCFGGIAKRSRDLVQPSVTTGGKWIREITGFITSKRPSRQSRRRASVSR